MLLGTNTDTQLLQRLSQQFPGYHDYRHSEHRKEEQDKENPYETTKISAFTSRKQNESIDGQGGVPRVI